ncbi:uncharacterized protein B0I36DRAFT_240060 [Microdochium trichocladiopsis]|uniref:LYR motif-containing protein Cup1-like N-terminal domain-containing protein n=1 Tax=Microdochium trichocladiopsis TaxID=1682393 RepID=A0A9P8YDJ4_9PEZI|nr:uncharacterized protein B0I36DRAFT_240060 [Microdochium trichocladiopsis]KAH7035950.1 hypothetical protein B0I36DRAFT_240060 [Microdochium trichocladiopsis]
MPPHMIPHPATPLHLYRHLLREASYLPLLCRPWITSRITTRYRECEHSSGQRAANHIKSAHGKLRYLRSANAGNVERLLHLCYLATGRLGKRRRVLAKETLMREPLMSSADLEAESENERPKHRKRKEKDWLDNWDTSKLRAVSKSQLEKKPRGKGFEMRRAWDPELWKVRETCRGFTIRDSQVRARERRGYRLNFKTLLPPLPNHEWERLEALATGKGAPEEYVLPPRRPVARSIIAHSSGGKGESISTPGPGLSWMDIISKPMRKLQHPGSRKMQSLSGRSDLNQDPRGPGRPIDTRVVTPRLLQRMVYKPVWEASARMNSERDKKTGQPRHRLQWGRVPVTLSQPSSKMLPFFEGVNDFGGFKASSPGLKGRLPGEGQQWRAREGKYRHLGPSAP